MFAPDGFTPFIEFFTNLTHRLVQNLPDSTSSAFRESAQRTISYYYQPNSWDEAELLAFAGVRSNLFMCSPEGRLLKLSPQIAYEWADEAILAGDFLELPVDLPLQLINSQGITSWRPSELSSHYFQVWLKEGDEDTEQFLLDEVARYSGLLDKPHRMPMFFERSSYTIDFDGFDFFNAHAKPVENPSGEWEDRRFDAIRTAMAFEKRIETLRPFKGWALCVPEESALQAHNSILNDEYTDSAARAAGRPRKQDKLLQAYEDAYPDGHRGLTAFQVLQSLNDATGLGASIDTMRRAIRLAKLRQAERVSAMQILRNNRQNR